MEELIGYIAGTLTTICFIPQAVKIIRDKETKGVSLAMYIIFATGVSCWFVYGIVLGSIPIIIFNIVTLLLTLLIIYNLFRYGKK